MLMHLIMILLYSSRPLQFFLEYVFIALRLKRVTRETILLDKRQEWSCKMCLLFCSDLKLTKIRRTLNEHQIEHLMCF